MLRVEPPKNCAAARRLDVATKVYQIWIPRKAVRTPFRRLNSNTKDSMHPKRVTAFSMRHLQHYIHWRCLLNVKKAKRRLLRLACSITLSLGWSVEFTLGEQVRHICRQVSHCAARLCHHCSDIVMLCADRLPEAPLVGLYDIQALFCFFFSFPKLRASLHDASTDMRVQCSPLIMMSYIKTYRL